MKQPPPCTRKETKLTQEQDTTGTQSGHLGEQRAIKPHMAVGHPPRFPGLLILLILQVWQNKGRGIVKHIDTVLVNAIVMPWVLANLLLTTRMMGKEIRRLQLYWAGNSKVLRSWMTRANSAQSLPLVSPEE